MRNDSVAWALRGEDSSPSHDLPFRLAGLLGSADGDRVISCGESMGVPEGDLMCVVEDAVEGIYIAMVGDGYDE